MKRFWGHALSTTAVAWLVGSTLPACAHDDSTVFIAHVMAPPITAIAGGTCAWLPDPTLPYLPSGLADAALTDTYEAWFLVGNQMRATAQPDRFRVETSRVVVTGATVKVVDPRDGSTWMDNTVLTSGSIDPSQGGTPTYGVVNVGALDHNALTHFDPGTIGAPANIAVAYVKVLGQTLGGQSVESNEYQFPINVCHGCLVYFPPGTSATNNLCATGTTTTTIPTPCSIGSDQMVPCTTCVNSNPTVCDPTKL